MIKRILLAALIVFVMLFLILLALPKDVQGQVEKVPGGPTSRMRVWAYLNDGSGCRVYQVDFRNDFKGYFLQCVGYAPIWRD